ncbi:hypothetical protein B0A55_00670 [Friedmanniomyces simplex]|uniref:Zn(2)-C6 fungal-type domain-containing protein n=1 Tax=Friedmanniomyces simplex TaxID=329884 RepID=A0A4U0XYV1_9PEZI|nr:hypothetical protein B0A55_00670 [Friedmanniomyces simplex]
MTSTVIAATGPASMEANGITGPPPRKRRRRTAGGGATDDCFACRKRAVKCDRKRPYCTQCIEIGKECSGYKTTLTWGVGVASRGKLRGLACPIANKNVDGSDILPGDVGGRRRKSSLSTVKKEDVGEASSASTAPMVPMAGMNELPPRPQAALPTLPMPIPQQRTSWQIPGYHEHIQARQDDSVRHGSFNLPPLHRLQTGGLGAQYGNHGMPSSAISVGSYAETEYHSPLEYPNTPGSLPFPESSLPNPYAEQPMTANSVDSYTMSSASTDSYAESVGATMHTSDFADSTISPSQAQLDPLDGMLFDGTDMSYANFDMFATNDGQDGMEDGEDDRLTLLDPRFSNPFFHLTPRLQSLMEYYDRYICPFLVAFDGPQNPYRRHILQLAVHNEGLQNALAALSTNNLRMRKKQPQRIGYVEELTDAFDGTPASDANPNEASAEESMYKQMSIDQLNLQLSDSRAAHDDSVLATLLILCLFHVCDSGFSKFKTQLAGVQKLLSLRNPSVQSDFTGWVEMFFTWFDVMTSTVNDREMQIKGESLDMLDFSANLGALEQFSGCDGRLFKLIARLGRLNLLAQGRPVRRNDGLETTPRMSAAGKPSTTSRFPRRKGKMFANRSLSALDYENMDGNGWGTPILSSDEDADGSADEDATTTSLPGGDDRREFWAEWHDVRTRLQTWQMQPDPTTTDDDPSSTSSHVPHAAGGHRDLIHINETFRLSALLYTTRLANPCLPSSHPAFQTLVAQALHHITSLSVTSCVNKFLLWPLFITGTECVDETHRAIIRARCVEVQKESGFFNNISGLEVLERVWREVGRNVQGMREEEEEVRARRRDSLAFGGVGPGMGRGRGMGRGEETTGARGSGGGGGRYAQAFRWRKAMDRVDGEYIVI